MGKNRAGNNERGGSVSIWEGPLGIYENLCRSVNVRVCGSRGKFPLVAGLIVEQGKFGRGTYWYPNFSKFVPIGIWELGGVLKRAEIEFRLEEGQLKVGQRSDLVDVGDETNLGFKVRGVFDPRDGVVLRNWGGPLVEKF